MSENIYKAVLEKIAAIMTNPPRDPTQDEDFYPDDYAGGNIDDAWYHGYGVGDDIGTWSVVKIARDALGLKDGD